MMKAKANQDLKDLMKKNLITQYELAKVLGLSETTLYRRLRDELEQDQKEIYLNAIHKIIKNN